MRSAGSRSLPVEHRLPALVLTGPAQPDDHQRALLFGFNALPVKPVECDEMLDRPCERLPPIR